MKQVLKFTSFVLLVFLQLLAHGQNPFITSWSVTDGDEITIPANTGFIYNFDYIWKDESGAEIFSATGVTGDIVQSFSVTENVTLEILGDFPHFQGYPKNQLIDVNQWGDIVWGSMFQTFNNWPGVVFSAEDNPDLSQVTDMSQMFFRAGSFNDDISDWDVSNVMNMAVMFRQAFDFNQDLSAWVVDNVTAMNIMFENADSFNQDLSSWNVGNVTNMGRMFAAADKIDQDFGSWDVSQVTNMNAMFSGSGLSTSNYDQTLIGWAAQENLQSGVTLTATNISFCSSNGAKAVLEGLGWTIVDAGQACERTTDILSFIINEQVGNSIIDTANATISVPVPVGTDVTALSPIIVLGAGASSSPASGEAVNFTNPVLYNVTYDIPGGDGAISEEWTVSVFEQSTFITSWSVTDGDEITIPVNTAFTYDFNYVWKNASGAEIASATDVTGDIVQSFAATETVTLEIIGDFPHFQGYPKTQLLDVTQWGDIIWGSMNSSFQDWPGADFSATDLPNLTEVEDMSRMFQNTAEFNGDLSEWEVDNVTDMSFMFTEAQIFNGDLSEWEVGNVTTMNHLFNLASAFNADLSGWNVSNVTDMTQMLNDSDLSQENYDALLAAWSQQDVQEGVTLGAGNLTFCEGEVARNTLINDKGWDIIEDEKFCPTDIQFFAIPGQIGSTIVDETNFEIIVDFPEGFDLTALIPSFTLFEGTTSIPASGEVQDFMNPVTYTLTTSDGSTQDWTVILTESRAFITSWSVTDGDEIIIPANTGFTYNFNYVWRNASGTEIFSDIGVTGDIVQSFTVTENVTLEITGDFPHFRNYPKDQLLDVTQWGDIVWGSMANSFQNWTGTSFSAADNPDLSQVTNMSVMFREATNFNSDLSTWDVSNVTNMAVMFREAIAFNSDISGWDMSSVTNTNRMLLLASRFNQDLSGWDISKVTDMTGMLSSSAISPQNFDNILVGWANLAQTTGVVSGVRFDAVGTTFCKGAAARDILSDPDTFNWTINDGGEFCSSETDILSFVLTDQTGDTVINPDTHTIDIEVLFTNVLDTLAPRITLSPGATSNPISGFVQDFSNAVTYIVTAEDGSTTQDWTINVTVAAPGPETDILTFALDQQTGEAIIDLVNHTVGIEVAFGTDLTNLAPEISLSRGAISNPIIGTAQDFSSEVTYTVTSADGENTQDWTVNVTLAENTATDILTFTIDEQTGVATIDPLNHTVAIEVSFGTNISSLTPTFTLSEGAVSNPVSGDPIDFTDPVTYQVTAEDEEITEDWTILVTIAPASEETDILTFSLDQQVGNAVINATDHTVAIEVAFGTGVAELTPMITLSDGAVSNPASGTVQDFTNAVTYTVTAEDGTTNQDWIISVTVEEEVLSAETDILTFVLAEQAETAVINTTNHTVAIGVTSGTDVTTLTPTITLSEGATSDPANGATVNFSNRVTYTVTADDESTSQDWVVTVTQVEQPLGLDGKVEISTYPNPVSDILHVKTEKEVHISLTDLNGRVIMTEKQGSLFEMDLSQLKNGTYLLMIQSGSQITSRRIIKSN
ncbi:BspA family leucine-rich repeat surface protein [Ekhidna sp.]